MASEEGEKKMVTVKCADGKVFQVPLEACALSQTIGYAVESCGDQDAIVVPLSQVNGVTFKKVLRYLLKHQDDCAGAGAEKGNAALKAWDAEFIEADTGTLYHFLASNYLEIEGLVDLCATRFENLIKGKQPETRRSERRTGRLLILKQRKRTNLLGIFKQIQLVFVLVLRT